MTVYARSSTAFQYGERESNQVGFKSEKNELVHGTAESVAVPAIQGASPPISPEQLKKISNLFSLRESSQEACFAAVFEACQKRNWGLVEQIKKECDLLVNAKGRSLLLESINQGEMRLAGELLHRKISIHTKDHDKNNALHYAIRARERVLIAKLWEHLPINQTNALGQTPLHIAVECNQPQIVSDLLANGTPIGERAQYQLGGTVFADISPLQIAIIKDHRTCIDVLLGYSSEQLPIHKQIGNLLHFAIHFRQRYVLKHLLTTHYAVVQSLVDQTNSEGLTPAMYAAYLGEGEMLILLKEKKASLELTGSKGRSAVHWAALGRQKSSLDVLYHYECSFNRADDDGNRPYDLVKSATDSSSKSIANYLSNLDKRQHREKELPSVYTLYPPENLVFKGGGPKGIAYVGAVEALEKEGALTEVIRVAGTSAGAINAALMAVGFTSQEMRTVLCETQLTSFLDHPLTKQNITEALQNLSFMQAIGTIYSTYQNIQAAYQNPSSYILTTLKKLWGVTGVCKGEVFRMWMERHLKAKTGIAYCTFGDLATLIQQGKPYKHLHVFTCEIGRGQLLQLSSEDPQWKDVIISDAVRASMSIPGVFNPHILHIKKKDQPLPAPELGTHIDGGLVRNSPTDAFDKRKYLSYSPKGQSGEFHTLNRRTLGLSLFSPKDKEIVPAKSIQTVGDLLCGMISIYWQAEAFYRDLVFDNQFRTIEIDNQGVGMLEFGLSPERQQALISSGREAVHRFYDAQKELTTRENSLYLFTRAVLQSRHTLNLDLSPQEFVGRIAYLEQLKKILLEPTAPLLQVVLTAAPGMGKSSTALAFAKAHLQDFSLIWWIASETPSTLKTSYHALAQELGVPYDPTDSLAILQRDVHRALETRKHSKPYLLIFDNAEQVPPLPTGGRGRVLITSRYKNLWKNFIEMRPFTEQEAVQFLAKLLKTAEDESLAILAKQLGYHPLALSQVGRYLAITPGITPKIYLEMLEKQAEASLKLAVPEAGYPVSLITSWQITQDSLEKVHPLALHWFQCCAFLYPENIPISWIYTWLQKEKGDPVQCQIEQGNILQTLTDRGLIHYNPERQTFSLHRIYQTLCRMIPTATERESEILLLLNKLAENLDIDRLGDWPLYAEWVPHAEQFLATCPKRTLEIADLADQLGVRMYLTGYAQQALVLHQRALEIRRKELNSEHLDVATSLNCVGNSLNYLDRAEEALDYHKRSLAIREKQLGSEHLSVATSLNNIGNSLNSLDRAEEALDYHKRALAILEKRLSGEHLRVAKNLDCIGHSLNSLGRAEEALVYHKRALAIQEKRLASEHPDVATSLSHIGSCLYSLGQIGKALDYHKRALAIREKRLGSEHPDVAISLNNIGCCLYSLGQTEKALDYHKRALAIWEKRSGSEHLGVTLSLNNIGTSLGFLGRREEALSYLKQAFMISCKVHKREHRNVVRFLRDLVSTLKQIENHELIQQTKQELLPLCKATLGENHVEVQALISVQPKQTLAQKVRKFFVRSRL